MSTQAMRLEDLVLRAKDGEHGNIPQAKFIRICQLAAVTQENVESFIGAADPVYVESLYRELLQKFRFMEGGLLSRKEAVAEKIISIKETLEALELLKKQKEKEREGKSEILSTRVQLAETIHVEATLPPTDTVCLWLAAGVVMEYHLDEAEDVLKKSLCNHEKRLEETEDEMEWLRTQITTTEVNVARVHNFAVFKREQAKAAASARGVDSKRDVAES